MCPVDDDTSVRPLDHGGRLGPYKILSPIGAGGMGIVYRARDERLGRDVAVKVIRAGLLADEAARKRFRTEALALGKLNHPNIATVYDVGTQDGADYLVMEFVQGETLQQRLASGAIAPHEVIPIAIDIAAALEEAHEQHVVHRDLKPANIIVTPRGRVKILDFGLAKLLAGSGPDDVTQPAADTGVIGTPLYMSPEQAEGKVVDARTDLWSLGVVLYEALTGQAPFRGDSGLAILRAITRDRPQSLRKMRPDVPPDVEKIVERALEKNVDSRYQSASEMIRDLSASSEVGPPKPLAVAPRKLMVVPGAIVLAIVAAGAWLYHRSERRHWAREERLPQIRKDFDADRPLAAFALLNEVQPLLPGDPMVTALISKSTEITAIDTTPPGATVEVQDYLAPDAPWLRLGVTPLHARLPHGYFRWRLSASSLRPFIAAAKTTRKMTFDLQSQQKAPDGMTFVSGGVWGDMIAFVGWVGPYNLPPYYLDRTEVTNRDYQRFVDSAGYANQRYWPAFVKDGHQVSWDEAMSFFRDRTGRAGPSTWTAGHYPAGQDDYPVTGVSWYEASAYAAYAGKSLPTFAQWFHAAPTSVGAFVVAESNIARTEPASAGKFPGVGPFGTVDMIGNAREWIANSDDNDAHFLLGGAWNSQPYLSAEPEALPAFDRSPTNGFRCVRNISQVPPAVAAPIRTQRRDFAHYTPASDEVFHAYAAMYSYDKTPLDAKREGVVDDNADWREEKVSFNAAYAGERVTAYLFLPKKVRPPLQTVLFFPSARVLYQRDSRSLGDVRFFDYIVQSGRAVMYPVYKGTYERQDKVVLPGMRGNVERMVQQYKDVARSIDYLRSRPDVDSARLAYLGVSMGAATGVIYCALSQEALKTAVFLDGGYFLDQASAGGDQADFAPRLKIPVLMVNGRYDFTFPLQKAQQPLFGMLGTPAADKRHLVLETPHDVSAHKTELIGTVLPWLDKYLGRVQ